MIHRSRKPACARTPKVVILCLVACLLAVGSGFADVHWRSGGVSVSSPMQPEDLEESLVQLSQRPDHRRVVLHLDGPLDPGARAGLAANGIRVLSYLGDHAYIAALTPSLDARQIAANGIVQKVEPIATVHKLHPDLAAGRIHEWSVLPSESKEAGAPAAFPRVAIYMLLHVDADVETKAPELVARYDGRVASWMRSINGAVVHLPADRIVELAAEDAVLYLEPPLPQMIGLNDDNRTRIQAETVNAVPYSLDGAGVMVLVYDAGKMFAHVDFGTRLTIGPSDTDGISDHATHVGGTIGGSGGDSSGLFRGMAPAVDLISYAYEQEGGLSQGFLYTDPGDLEADYTEAISLGADLSNNSIGTNTASNGFPCEWEGNYGATGMLIDAIARGSLGDPFRIVWANGNERSGGSCGSTYLTTAPPACAKNHITVGALNSDSDGVTGFTSWGPTDDGRLKPDISGPGCQGGGDGGVTSTSSSGGYNVKCGTSMASPTVAGVSALLLQQFRLSNPGAPDFRNSTLKAILANSAEDIVDPGPDYQSGYGSVRAVPAADTIIEERFVEAEVAQGEIYSFLILVEPGETQLKVTAAWDDPPGLPSVTPVLVNDLDLQVIGPDSTVYYPWTLDAANPSTPAVRTQRDGLNNIEQVAIDNPTPGAYRVEVVGFNIAEGPTQSFGAAASPSLINCAPTGVVSTSATSISCSADLTVQVIDCDLNTSDAVVETVNVSVTSDSEPAGESLLLTETAAESAAFQGSIGIDAVDGSGVIQVAEGDTVTVSYLDADDGEGGTNVTVLRNVIVDCTAPLISTVTVTDVQPRSATADVATDEPARVTVHYGTTCGAPSEMVQSLSLNTLHEIRFGNLQDSTTYFFTVAMTDGAGNMSSNDNGGACYSFSTPMIPDFFTEQFSSGVDLEGMQTTFTPNGSNDFYSACTEPITALPTDPAGGADLGLSDDQPGQFDLTGGATVSLYGLDYGTVHVGPNGYVTFTSGDSDYTETFSDHFDLPRVSALFDDLNPSSAGTVSWLQLADRVAVTWENVPEYSSSNSNTFQIELFFDGKIRLSWIQVDASDAIVGISAGAGVDPDFFETDLSGGGGCLPTPPTALNDSATTARDVAVTLALRASDDGQPAPLTYRVTALPASGRIADPVTGAAILGAPYDLAAGGNTVIYTPDFGYEGPDTFSFIADDGGAQPDGGPSNAATVDVAVGGPQPVVEALVDDGDPGWSTGGGWAFGNPTGSGSGSGDPDTGHTDSNVYGYNLSGDYTDEMTPQYLTTPSFDFSDASGTQIEFRRWLGVLAGDHAAFEISVNGGADWSSLWSLTSGLSESAWSMQSFDVSALADGQPAVSFRWIMGKTDLTGTHPGWNLDDIRVTADFSCSDAPTATSDLLFDDPQSLRWTAPLDGGGTSAYYDVLRSDDAADFGGAQCLEVLDGADRRATDAGTPVAGNAFFYLIRARNACGESGIGTDSDGVDRVGAVCVP